MQPNIAAIIKPVQKSTFKGWSSVSKSKNVPISFAKLLEKEHQQQNENNQEKKVSEKKSNINKSEDDEEEEIKTIMRESLIKQKQGIDENLIFNEIEVVKPVDLNVTKSEMIVYDDDPALGTDCPNLKSIELTSNEKIEIGRGNLTVITFYSKLNKSDFPTLSYLSRLKQKYGKYGVDFLGISRDSSESMPGDFLKKYQGKYMAESSVLDEDLKTVNITFPLGFDKDSAYNEKIKVALRRSLAPVGLVIIVGQTGKIEWFEYFVRGVNPAKQFQAQLSNILKSSKAQLVNGNQPKFVDGEEDDNIEIKAPDNLDFLGINSCGGY